MEIVMSVAALCVGLLGILIFDELAMVKRELRNIKSKMLDMDIFMQDANMFIAGRINMTETPEKTPGMP